MRLKSGLTSKFAAMSGAVFCMWLAFGVYMNYNWYEALADAAQALSVLGNRIVHLRFA